MKKIFNCLIIFLFFFFQSCFTIDYEPKTNGSNLKSRNLTSDSILVIDHNDIIKWCDTTKGYKHIYLFSESCSPCRKSFKKNTYDLVTLNNVQLRLPTIVVSCNDYSEIDNLIKVVSLSNVKTCYILDNVTYKTNNDNLGYQRLENYLERYYFINKDNSQIGYPYNIILDSNNKLVCNYAGAIVN